MHTRMSSEEIREAVQEAQGFVEQNPSLCRRSRVFRGSYIDYALEIWATTDFLTHRYSEWDVVLSADDRQWYVVKHGQQQEEPEAKIGPLEDIRDAIGVANLVREMTGE